VGSSRRVGWGVTAGGWSGRWPGWAAIGGWAGGAARTPTSGTSSVMAWSIISSRPAGARSRCRWRAAPTAPRAFPGPRSPCGPCRARLQAAGSACAAGRPAGRGDRPAGAPPGWPAPAAHHGRAACATWRSATCTGPRAAAAHPCGLVQPLVLGQDPRLVAGRVPPRATSTLGDLRVRLGHVIHGPRLGCTFKEWSVVVVTRGTPSPPCQLNDSAARSASLEVDTAMIPAVVAATGLTLVDTGFVPCL
jgi:hypothetical protein